MVSEDDGTGEPVQISYYLMEIETGAVSEEKTIEVKIDTTAPELTGITWFSHRYDSLNVSIKSNETGSIEYVLVEDPGTENVTVVFEPGDTKSVPVEAGVAANISFEGLEANKGYQLWQEYDRTDIYAMYLEEIMEDAVCDYNVFSRGQE